MHRYVAHPDFKRVEVLSGVDRGLPCCLSHVQIKQELTHRMYLNPIVLLKISSFDQTILPQFLWGGMYVYAFSVGYAIYVNIQCP